jgi:hypothetical protein
MDLGYIPFNKPIRMKDFLGVLVRLAIVVAYC